MRFKALFVAMFSLALCTSAFADEFPVTFTSCGITGNDSVCHGSVTVGGNTYTANFSTPSAFDTLYLGQNGTRIQALDGEGDTSIDILHIDLGGHPFGDFIGTLVGTPDNVKKNFEIFTTSILHPDGYLTLFDFKANSNGLTEVSFFADPGDQFLSIQLGVGDEHDDTAAKFFGLENAQFSEVPEPTSLLLFGAGLSGLAFRKRS